MKTVYVVVSAGFQDRTCFINQSKVFYSELFANEYLDTLIKDEAIEEYFDVEVQKCELEDIDE